MDIEFVKKEVPSFSGVKNILNEDFSYSHYFFSAYNHASTDHDAFG